MLRPAGEGLLFQQFSALKEKLEAEGLFDEERKRPLPPFPKTIGIVTSPSAAALQDMLNTLRMRFPLAAVILSPASVQGVEAPPEIVRAIRRLERQGKADVILVARGGGSLEDLWAFNDEQVARAIAACSIPVISGVGHETDFTLADFAADYRAPTPTGAAVAATPDIREISLDLQAMGNALQSMIESRTASLQEQIQTRQMILQRYSPARKIYELEQQVDHLQSTLQRVIKYQQERRNVALEHFDRRLDAANPRNVLKRGYAILQDEENGDAIQSVKQVLPEQNLRITMLDGQVIAKSKKILPLQSMEGSSYE